MSGLISRIIACVATLVVMPASLVRRTRALLHGRDLLLLSGGVTFYAALATVPALFVAVRLAALVAGPERVVRLGHSLSGALPNDLGAADLAQALVDRAAGLGLLHTAVAVLPASLYGEGLRRCFLALCGAAPEAGADRLTGWRGRVAVLPLLAAAPGLLLIVLGVAARVGDQLRSGGLDTVLGVVLAFTVDWLCLSVALVWTFRVVAPARLSWPAAAVGGVLTASFVAGFLQGFVLFLSLPLDLGAPFGGLTAVGGAAAVLLWLWLLHLVVLVGYATTVAGHELLSSGRSLTRGSPASAW